MKKTLFTLLSLALILSTMFSASALTLETVETNTAPAVVDAELAAEPVNILTSSGTFDNGENFSNGAVVADPADASNNVFTYAHSYGRQNTYYNSAIPFVAGKDYVVSFDYKVAIGEGGSGKGYFHFTNYAGTKRENLPNFIDIVLPTEWTHFEETMPAGEIATANTDSLWLYFGLNDANTTIYVDNLCIYEAPAEEPEPKPEEPAVESILPIDGTFNTAFESSVFGGARISGPTIVEDPADATNKVMTFGSTGTYGTLWTKVDFADETDYIISFDISGDGSWTGVFLTYNSGNPISEAAYLLNATTTSTVAHKEVTLTADAIATAKAAGAPLWLYFQLNDANKNAYIDNLYVTPVPATEPEPEPEPEPVVDPVLPFDGTFETGSCLFTGGNGVTASIITDPANAENKVLCIDAASAGNYPYAQTQTGTLTFKEDTDYTFSYDVWAAEGSSGTGWLALQLGYNGWQGAKNLGAGIAPYKNTTPKTVTVDIPAADIAAAKATIGDKDIQIKIDLGGEGAGNILYFDNFKFTAKEKPVPDPNGVLKFDGSFEYLVAADAFTSGNGAAITYEADPTDADNKALKLVSGGNYAYIRTPLTLEENTDYAVSFDIWGDATANASVFSATTSFRYNGDNGLVWISNSDIALATTESEKTHLTYTFKADAIAGRGEYPYEFCIQINTSGKTLWFDNLVVTPIPAPEVTTLSGVQIRKDAVATGIRFASHLGEVTKARAAQTGFLVALTDALGENALAFDAANAPAITEAGKTVSGKTAESVAYLASANYVKDGRDISYADAASGNAVFGLEKADGNYYTVVLTGFDSEYTKGDVTYANRYAVNFTVRAYVLVDGVYYYGDANTTNMAKVAEAYLESDDADLKAFAQTVVDTANDVVTPEESVKDADISTEIFFNK